MKKWVLRIILLGVVGYLGKEVYDEYRGGYFDLPDLPDHAYTVSFKSGFRAILLNADVPETDWESSDYWRRLSHVNKERRYFGVPFDVPQWMEKAWSYCERLEPASEQKLFDEMPNELKSDLYGARFEGYCWVDIDGEKMARGMIFSVPRL